MILPRRALHGRFSVKVMELLKLFGVPYVVAPMEAEVSPFPCNAMLLRFVFPLFFLSSYTLTVI